MFARDEQRLSLGDLVDSENVTKLHTQNTTNSVGLKEERHVMKHILSITSSTCTLRYFYAGDDKWRQMSWWGLHMQVAQLVVGIS